MLTEAVRLWCLFFTASDLHGLIVNSPSFHLILHLDFDGFSISSNPHKKLFFFVPLILCIHFHNQPLDQWHQIILLLP